MQWQAVPAVSGEVTSLSSEALPDAPGHRTCLWVRCPGRSQGGSGFRLVVAGLLGLLLTAPGAAQTVRGRLLEAASGEPIPGGRVTLLLASDGTVVQRVVVYNDGTFHLSAPAAGRYQLRAERIGYRPTTGPAFDLAPHETLALEFRLAAAAVVLAPMTVVGREVGATVIDPYLEHQGYYDRKAIYGIKGSGWGRFLDGDQLRRTAARVPDLLQGVPGIHVQAAGGTNVIIAGRWCPPTIYLDGVRVGGGDIEDLPASAIVAVEVYAGLIGPLGPFDSNGCGVVIFWTGIRR